MQRCLTLASKGLGNTYPNPLVGALVVYKGKIIGEGWHKKAGGPHAEVFAIESVKDKSKLAKSTLVVSLEPCSHYGKTPPCSKLIVESGIQHVVVGMKDPFDAVHGRGIKHLQNCGIKVEVGVLENQCRELNKRFLSIVEKKRPYIILKWAVCQDGFLAPEHQNEGQPYWITEPPAQQLVHKWRAEEQAILVGRKTIEADNPQLNVRLWSGKQPTKLIIDPSCKVKSDSKIFQSEENIYVYNNKKQESHQNIHHILIDFNNEPLTQIMKHLYEVGIQSLIVEGGAATLGHFIDNGIWDEARVLTGQKKLSKGLRAPKINKDLKFVKESMCGVDKIQFFKNSSSG